ncbi:MAG: COP23 domain-containing protein [Trichodesmium sp. MAG_R02]|nr:COP23 domain-containing protein [Trichodesmium sp. MAG_R02]
MYKQVLKLLVVEIPIMKLQSILLTTAAASVVALGGIATFSQSSLAQKGNRVYFCGKSSNNIPTTYARTKTGQRISVISWQKPWSDEYTPKKRCQIVSQRFQKAEERGLLDYITSEVVKKQNVICATRRYGGPCQRVLFTLRDDDKPEDVLGALFGQGYKASGTLIQSEDGSPRYYLNVNYMIDQKSKSTTELK